MTHLSGVQLAGEYGLQEYLGTDASGALYRTTYGPDRKPALLKLIRPEPSSASEQLAFWKRCARLSHPNLLALLDCGRADSYLFSVFEFPDDTLQGAGTLDEAGAKQVLDSGLSGLRYLHSEGLAHGNVDAAHIVAVGEQIKLTTDALVPNGNYAEDMSALGALVYELATGARLAPGENPDPTIVPKSLRTPLRDLCVRKGAPGIRPARYLSIASAAAAAIALLLVVTRGSETSTKQPVAETKPAVSKPAPAPAPVKPAPAPPAQPVARPTSNTGSAARTAPAQPVPSPVELPKPSAFSPPPAVESPAATQGKTLWRVVAYTFSRYQDAETKAKTINGKWNGLRAEVFAPRGKQPPYFVSLGGRMTRADAEVFQKQAVNKGLPRDTFVRNFSN